MLTKTITELAYTKVIICSKKNLGQKLAVYQRIADGERIDIKIVAYTLNTPIR